MHDDTSHAAAPDNGALGYAGAEKARAGDLGRWANRLAIVALATPLLVCVYWRLGEHNTRRHVLGWSFIFHHDGSMAVWTPGNSLYAADLSGPVDVAFVASLVYLIAWVSRKVIVWFVGR